MKDFKPSTMRLESTKPDIVRIDEYEVYRQYIMSLDKNAENKINNGSIDSIFDITAWFYYFLDRAESGLLYSTPEDVEADDWETFNPWVIAETLVEEYEESGASEALEGRTRYLPNAYKNWLAKNKFNKAGRRIAYNLSMANVLENYLDDYFEQAEAAFFISMIFNAISSGWLNLNNFSAEDIKSLPYNKIQMMRLSYIQEMLESLEGLKFLKLNDPEIPSYKLSKKARYDLIRMGFRFDS
jgi:hypothetical protein